MKFKVSEEYIQDVIREFKSKVETSNNFNLEKLFEKPDGIEHKEKKIRHCK